MALSETLTPRSRGVARNAALLAGAIGLTACTGYMSEPRVIERTDPAVTYQYDREAELIEVTQNAEAYCEGFQAWPKTRSIVDNADGSKTVVFECERNAPPVLSSPAAVTTPAPVPGIAYSVGSDLELVNALHNANAYCRGRGMQTDTTTIRQAEDGTRTVSFRCIAA